MNIPHVQIILDQNQVPGPLRTALNRVKARVSLRSLDKALADGISPTADVCVILPRRQSGPDVLGRILADASDRACATMVLEAAEDLTFEHLSAPAPVRRLKPDPGGLSLLSADELTGRIKALCEIRSPMRKMSEEIARLRRRDAEAPLNNREFNEQLRLAGEIQRDLLPAGGLEVGPLAIETLYLPADFISGDIYDVSRLDENHLSLSVADATGHGLPAALLTIFLKNSFRGKEIRGDVYRILEPDEVLNRLNAELLDTRLSGCQFITGLHAVYDDTTRQIRWARGGLPYPVLIRPGEPPRRMASHGSLIGAFQCPRMEVVCHRFEPDDTLLFFTDGLEALLLNDDEAFSIGEIQDSTWVRQLAEEGVSAALNTIRNLAAATPDDAWRKDDITLLAVRIRE